MKNSIKIQTNSLYSLIIFSTLIMSGCGELSYKRGANLNDLGITKKTCAANNANQTEIEKCLADNGWFVHDLGSSDDLDVTDPVIEVAVNNDNRRIDAPLEISDKNRANANNSASNSNSPVTNIKKSADPMDIYKISSWWKIGGNASSLQLAINECIATLGEAHRPNSETRQVTRGMLLCMKEKGWHGLREK